jgi:hypothetical protein
MPGADVLRFNGAMLRDPQIAAWMDGHPPRLAALSREWFALMRAAGDEVLEVFHDGNAVACLGDVPFAYVGVFTAHVSVGFFQGATLPDPHRLLEGTGKRMRHVKLKPGEAIDTAALRALIEAAYAGIKERVERA